MKLADAMNEQLSRTIAQTRLKEYQEEVEIAKRLLSVAEEGQGDSDFIVFLRLAKAAHNVALNDWQRTKRIHERAPNDISELDVERLRLRSELALITYEQGQSLENASSAEQTQWKMNVLYNEVLRLSEQVSRLNQRRGR